MADIYGNLFLSKNGIEDSGAWFEVLKDLTPFALDIGIERLRSLRINKEKDRQRFIQYPPNCLEFRALCLSFYDDLNLPSTADAYRETISRTFRTNLVWSHPAVKYTAMRLGDEFLAIENIQEADAKFTKAYEEVCHLVRQGLPLPEITEQIMLPKPGSKDVAFSHLQQMRKCLGV